MARRLPGLARRLSGGASKAIAAPSRRPALEPAIPADAGHKPALGAGAEVEVMAHRWHLDAGSHAGAAPGRPRPLVRALVLVLRARSGPASGMVRPRHPADPAKHRHLSAAIPGRACAEADGNRTRQPCGARLTGFEDRGGHQAPGRLRRRGYPHPAGGGHRVRRARGGRVITAGPGRACGIGQVPVRRGCSGRPAGTCPGPGPACAGWPATVDW
jgi:hypothetical protein